MSPFYIFLACLVSLPMPSLSLDLLNSSAHICHHDEKVALLRFKSDFTLDAVFSILCTGLQVSYPKTRSWKANLDCCLWDGITCDSITGHVVAIDLSSSQLGGIIHPNSTLFHLQHLQTLNLACNGFFSSRIPARFGELRSLKLLNLSKSGFTGQVPSEIAQLSQLVVLDLSTPIATIISSLGSSFSSFKSYIMSLFLVSLEVYDAPAMPNLDIIAKNLTRLEILHLDSVKIGRVFPQALANLSSLTSLSLSSCNLQGEFPNRILQLPHLQTLILSFNPNLSVNAMHLSLINRSLEVLDFSMTNLSGSFPVSLDVQPLSLRKFMAISCNLQGFIPSWILNTTKELYLDENYLTGQLPSAISSNDFPHLTTLSLSNNMLSGSITLSLFTLPSLKYLDLNDNAFIGLSSIGANSTTTWSKLSYLGMASCNIKEFPHFLRSQKMLDILDLSNNSIKGEVPIWFHGVGKYSLLSLNLSYNLLTGGLNLTSWKALRSIDLRSNSFHGPLPLPPPQTTFFLASNNMFSGHISSSFCKLPMLLLILDLSNNSLNGEIPWCLGKLSNRMIVLNLESNKLHGPISMKFMKDCSLQSIKLNNNQLEGPVPQSLARCELLTVLDLGENRLNGAFPHWLDSLPGLQVLILRSNNFHGSIRENPKAKDPFPMLQILDLSRNQFRGKLPTRYFENFKALMTTDGKLSSSTSQYIGDFNHYQESIVLTAKGSALSYERILKILKTLDLSGNKFIGVIPDSLAQLVALVGLNLSHNHLTGGIPAVLSNLTSVESLDLSYNMLEGQIPSQLVRLTFLEVFNVSENRLVGPIPQGNQFPFSSDSYGGNLGLCGNPLAKCGEGNESHNRPLTQTPSQQGHTFDVLDLSLWEVILMGYGVGMVVGLVAGCYMILAGKPTWIAKKVDRMEYVTVQRYKKYLKKKQVPRN